MKVLLMAAGGAGLAAILKGSRNVRWISVDIP